LAEYLHIDATLVRIFFLLLGLASGIGIPVYLVMWVIVPYEGESPLAAPETARAAADEIAEKARALTTEVREALAQPSSQGALIVGLVLIFLGVVALLRNLHFPWLWWLRFDVLWPLLLILAGLVLLWRRTGSGR